MGFLAPKSQFCGCSKLKLGVVTFVFDKLSKNASFYCSLDFLLPMVTETVTSILRPFIMNRYAFQQFLIKRTGSNNIDKVN